MLKYETADADDKLQTSMLWSMILINGWQLGQQYHQQDNIREARMSAGTVYVLCLN
jgi:hypothetical protein